MGVLGFRTFVQKYFPSSLNIISQAKFASLQHKYEHLFMDANCMLHLRTRKRQYEKKSHFSYSHFDDDVEKQQHEVDTFDKQAFCNEVVQDVQQTIQLFEPTSSVHVVCDGVAAFAKIDVQRRNRYRVCLNKIVIIV